MAAMLKLAMMAAVLASATARLAPHYLSVGSGLGMPNAVKDKYHTTDNILSSLEALEKKCPQLTRHEVEAIDPSTNAPKKHVAYTLTDSTTSKDSKKRFMLTFGMHGREYISSETALYLSQFSCERMSQGDKLFANVQTSADTATPVEAPKPAEAAEPVPGESAPISMLETGTGLGLAEAITKGRLENILKHTEITFFPVLNVAGRKKLESGDSCTNQRKNGRNVDLNRNFADWYNPSNAQPSDEDYQGPGPMSEWESNCVKTLADQFHPHAYIDVHSGDLGMGYVYGHSGSEKSPDDALNSNWVRAVNSEAFGGKVWNGNLANMGSFPYESHGSSCDYMYKSQHARISGTWEIWRKPSFFQMNADASASKAAAGTTGSPSYDYVSTSVTKVEAVSGSAETKQAGMLSKESSPVASSQNALQVESVQVPSKESTFQMLIESAVGESGHNEELGLSRDDVQMLVQSMSAEGKPQGEIQELLQDMSREQCFAYFNPVMPQHYDSTVSGFTHAILVGAEKLSSAEFAKSFA